MFKKLLMLSVFFSWGVCNAALTERNAIRLHTPVVSSFQGVEQLRLVAATANIPVYEDATGKRFLAGVDFAPFLNAWLEAQLVLWGHTPESPVLFRSGEVSDSGVLLQVMDLNINLTEGVMTYVCSFVVFTPRKQSVHYEFGSRIELGKLEESRLEAHKLLSHDLGPLLATIRNLIAGDLSKHAAKLKELIAGK